MTCVEKNLVLGPGLLEEEAWVRAFFLWKSPQIRAASTNTPQMHRFRDTETPN